MGSPRFQRRRATRDRDAARAREAAGRIHGAAWRALDAARARLLGVRRGRLHRRRAQRTRAADRAEVGLSRRDAGRIDQVVRHAEEAGRVADHAVGRRPDDALLAGPAHRGFKDRRRSVASGDRLPVVLPRLQGPRCRACGHRSRTHRRREPRDGTGRGGGRPARATAGFGQCRCGRGAQVPVERTAARGRRGYADRSHRGLVHAPRRRTRAMGHAHRLHAVPSARAGHRGFRQDPARIARLERRGGSRAQRALSLLQPTARRSHRADRAGRRGGDDLPRLRRSSVAVCRRRARLQGDRSLPGAWKRRWWTRVPTTPTASTC